MFVINETLGKLKDYSLAKTLLKGLPKILVSVYAIAIIISFFGSSELSVVGGI